MSHMCVVQEEAAGVIIQQWPRDREFQLPECPRAAGYQWKKLVLSLDPVFCMGHGGRSPVST